MSGWCDGCGGEMGECWCPPKGGDLSDSGQSAGWVYLEELSPELNELLANTPTLTDSDIEELAEANRRLGLPWWKRLFKKPNDGS